MKNVFAIGLTLFFYLSAFSQTKEIERKCNSGTNSTQDRAETYGLKIYYQTHYRKIGNCIIEVTVKEMEYGDLESSDTITEHSILCQKKLTLDTIQKYYNRKLDSFEGFGKKIDSFGKGEVDKGFLVDAISKESVLFTAILLLFLGLFYNQKKRKSA